MSVFTVIPVKALHGSKTRLSMILNPEERQVLVLTMLEDVLKAVMKSSLVHQIVIISSDSRVRDFTRKFGTIYLPEKMPGLNQAIKQAMHWCIQNDAKSVLFLPADIPLITPIDVNQLFNMCSDEICVVIAPSRNGGTNALLQKPPDLIPLHFGPGSFSKHLAEASKKGIMTKIYDSESLSMDIDSFEDLRNLLKIEAQTASHRFLNQIGVNIRLTRIKN